MTIDEAIAREKQLEKEQRSHIGTWDEEYSKKCELYAEEHEQLAEWLEELKNNRIALEKANGYLQANYNLGYNKAIDDFVNVCKEDILCQTFGLHINGIERIAEQLKARLKK